MSEAHLQQLRLGLERHHWCIVAEQSGDDYSISAVWLLSRPDGSMRIHLDFEGAHEIRVLPITEAYGCHVREAPAVSLYFARISRSWNDNLGLFLGELDTWSVNPRAVAQQSLLN